MELNKNQPLGEVFGFSVTNTDSRAKRYLRDKLCPYNNVVSNCTKNSIEHPLGVCSLMHQGRPVIICPVRFREDWKIVSDAAAFVLEGEKSWTHFGEVNLRDKHGKSAGKIDYVLVSYDDKGRVTNFGSLEVQSVYISGNLTGPFEAYMESPSESFIWDKALKYPKPDYLSSSRKRLIPQVVAKGTILKQWNKKQAVALQSSFYETLPKMIEVDRKKADFAFFLYDLNYENKRREFNLKKQNVIYTRFENVLEQIAKFDAGPIENFTKELQSKLDKKRYRAVKPVESEKMVIE